MTTLTKVNDIRENMIFVTDSDAVAEYNNQFEKGFNSYFVDFYDDGSVKELWGMYGLVPELNRLVWRVV